MSKKSVKKATKPLPSALSTASRGEPSGDAPVPRLTKAVAVRVAPPCPPPAAKPEPAPSLAAVAKPAPPRPVSKAPALPPAPETAPLLEAAPPVKATFMFFEPHATRISLCGEFNGWSPEATPMQRQADGHWEATLALAPGRYQYKFVVDGQWIPDPRAQANVFNEHGTLNSVVELGG
jgi:hypothetical protein